MVSFMHHLFGTIKGKQPHAILDLNSYIRPATDWSDGHPLKSLHLEDSGGVFFVESFSSLREPSFVAKTLRATNTPFAVFRNFTQKLQGFGAVPYPEVYLPAISSFSTIANGGQPCGDLGLQPDILTGDATKWVLTELKKKADYIKGDTVKYVALHYLQQNRDFHPSELPKNTVKTYFYEIGQKDTYGAKDNSFDRV